MFRGRNSYQLDNFYQRRKVRASSINTSCGAHTKIFSDDRRRSSGDSLSY
jgi:hypothetical protein